MVRTKHETCIGLLGTRLPSKRSNFQECFSECCSSFTRHGSREAEKECTATNQPPASSETSVVGSVLVKGKCDSAVECSTALDGDFQSRVGGQNQSHLRREVRGVTKILAGQTRGRHFNLSGLKFADSTQVTQEALSTNFPVERPTMSAEFDANLTGAGEEGCLVEAVRPTSFSFTADPGELREKRCGGLSWA